MTAGSICLHCVGHSIACPVWMRPKTLDRGRVGLELLAFPTASFPETGTQGKRLVQCLGVPTSARLLLTVWNFECKISSGLGRRGYVFSIAHSRARVSETVKFHLITSHCNKKKIQD